MLQKINTLLEKHQLRKTAFRQQVLEIFLNMPSRAMSQTLIEETLGPHDRITLYRTLKSFQEKGLIHEALDSARESKYALCQDDCDVHQHTDDHPHFHCERCGNTYCMDTLQVPRFSLPDKYELKDVQLALSGVCDACNTI